MAVTDKDVHPQFIPVTRSRIICADGGPDPAHSLHHGWKIDLGARGNLNAEPPGVCDISRRAGGTDEAFGWNASDIQAITTHEVSLDEGNLRPQTRGPGGCHQPGSAGADDHQIVFRRRLRIDPGFGMDIGDQLLIKFVQW